MGQLVCSWRERAQDCAELWPPGFSLLCGLGQDTLIEGLTTPTLKLLNSALLSP